MLPIIGYGEDALTLWFLKQDDKVKELVNNESIKCIFYRPSFGRGTSPAIGEFDAIIKTNSKIYLIESKWEKSQEVKKDRIVVKARQVLRHLFLQSYILNKKRNQDHYKIIGKKVDDFIKWFASEEKKESKSILYNNFKNIMDKIDTFENTKKKEIENILLLFCSKKLNNSIKNHKIDFEIDTNTEINNRWRKGSAKRSLKFRVVSIIMPEDLIDLNTLV